MENWGWMVYGVTGPAQGSPELNIVFSIHILFSQLLHGIVIAEQLIAFRLLNQIGREKKPTLE